GDTCSNGVCVGGAASPFAACETCDDARGCVLEPRASCRIPADRTKSSLLVRDRTPDTGDVLAWKWLKGDSTVDEFGAGGVPSDEALCIWGGDDRLLYRGVASAAATCGTASCWKPLGVKGYRYKNSAGTPSGITSLLLSAGVGGRAKIVLKGKGALLSP